VGRRRVELAFDGGAVTSDAGLLLLRQTDLKLGLLERVVPHLPDPRDPTLIEHTTLALLRQRVYAIAQGYEDLNDHDRLRHDPALSTALGKLTAGASSPTLCRFENRADRKAAVAIHEILVECFIASFATPPEELVLDFDATDDPVHGRQEGRFFHGYYDHYCFLPLYVFCGEQLLCAYLRPSNIDAAKHAGAVLKWLVRRLRAAFPLVRLIFRGDSGFCRRRILAWCERQRVGYVVGLAKNPRLLGRARDWLEAAWEAWELTGEKQRLFGRFWYRAGPWKTPRQVIIKAEITHEGDNPRFLITNLDGEPQALYDRRYCPRGEMENRIKECQLGLFADRTSCHGWWANQFRLLLSSLAYVLIERLRALALAGTELARAQATTLRVKLLKLGAVVLRNTRRIRFLASSHFPLQELFLAAAQRLKPSG
jgi:hypothetical protein